ncbi:glycoside hydrolase superfamily [Jimgerdemannia flammicorona]|uniref:Probable beta-glucosidase G n=1 Tax=Jimgerdemannia flammicorona TaxID=994334 RepID=A0A433QME8_9FUNG|nr:glycoside hydrolase superfamily [Jimgerdemannia flammicorona]
MSIRILAVQTIHAIDEKPWLDASLPYTKRADLLLYAMNLDEKLTLVHGIGGQYVGNVPNNTRLAIPALHLQDGPQGVAGRVTNVTAFPSVLTVTAAWDPSLMELFASAIAVEQRIKGANVMLGPMINIARIPVGGRNFESMGEDPYLAARLVASYVRGVQKNGVMACAKHWANNNQEHSRMTVGTYIDERTEWEIYYPAFQAAVDADVASVMCAYNLVNGTYACENYKLLTVNLKERMGFKYFVMSDWFAVSTLLSCHIFHNTTHSTVQSVNAGLDQEMPDRNFFNPGALKQAISQGLVTTSRIDDMVRRILLPMFKFGLFDRTNEGTINAPAESRSHRQLAHDLAAVGTVLLKNRRGILPLREEKIASIAVIGDAAHLNPVVVGLVFQLCCTICVNTPPHIPHVGGGSGSVHPPHISTPLDGIRSRAGKSINVTYTPGGNGGNMALVEDAARKANVVIVVVGATSAEGVDRPNLLLPLAQDAMVERVTAANPNTVVVVYAPGAVLMPWKRKVAAIVCGFLPGQEAGDAIAEILFGDVNPSGKLPLTFPLSETQVATSTPIQYPGIDNREEYIEKLLVGYRWYDALKKQPLYPFGHGLSYTTFRYHRPTITLTPDDPHCRATVRIDVRNTGDRAGTEVVQLYLGFPPWTHEPPRQLKGFQRVFFEPGEIRTIEFMLDDRAFRVWDAGKGRFVVAPGRFRVFVGSSSRDVRAEAHVIDLIDFWIRAFPNSANSHNPKASGCDSRMHA